MNLKHLKGLTKVNSFFIFNNMTTEEINTFNYLNNTSYLLRLILEQNKFEIQPIKINSNCVYHVTMNGHTIGTIVSRVDDENNYTYNNIRLYKYFKTKFPKTEDFIMSEYFIKENDKIVRFNFDKFNDWVEVISKYVESMGILEPDEQEHAVFNDSLNRLTELVDEYDEKFSNNILISDIRMLLNENERLNNELIKKSNKLMELFLKVK